MRFHGVVGYGESQETEPGSGVWEEVVTEFPYTGDVQRDIRRTEHNEQVIGDIRPNNSISIVADQYANDHYYNMKYVVWNGVRWVVTTVQVQPPRLILSLGGVYNGPTPQAPE